MHSCVGNGGFAVCRLKTVIAARLADTSVPESRLYPHAGNLSYLNESQVPQQLRVANPVLVKHSPNLADFCTSNTSMSILHFNTFL